MSVILQSESEICSNPSFILISEESKTPILMKILDMMFILEETSKHTVEPKERLVVLLNAYLVHSSNRAKGQYCSLFHVIVSFMLEDNCLQNLLYFDLLNLN